MKRNAWLLSAAAVAALSSNALLAQAPIASPAPVMTSAPVINVSDPVYYGGDGGGSGGGMHLTADVGFMVLTPKFSDNPALYAQRFSPAAGVPDVFATQDFSYHEQFVPALSFGIAGQCGLGVRINWFGFEVGAHEAATATTTTGLSAASPLQIMEQTDFGDAGVGAETAGQTLSTFTGLRMDVWDLEVTDNFGGDGWSFVGSAGIRYAHIAQAYIATGFDTVEGDASTSPAAILSGHNFDGEGPTVSLEGKRLVGDMGLYVYGKARGSLLFGTSKQFAVLVSKVDDIAGFAASRTNSIIPETDVEFGAGFQRETRMGDMFVKLGFVGQAWFNVGNASQSAGAPDFMGDADTMSAPNKNSTLGLVGFVLSAGIGY